MVSVNGMKEWMADVRYAAWRKVFTPMRCVAIQSFLTHELQTDIVNRHVVKMKQRVDVINARIEKLDRRIEELKQENREIAEYK